ncbi:opsin [Histoplasma ohiense]|nr:opsin [Histoplasma ohiense (nom. inval.)]
MIKPTKIDSFRSSSTISPIPTIIPNEPIYQEISATGYRTLWVVAILMLLSSLIFYILASRVPVQKRLFHVLASLVATVSFLAYFAMATGGGKAYNHAIIHEHHKNASDTIQHIYREVYWVRYVNWGLTFPMILIILVLLAGMNGASLLISIVANLVMNIAGAISAYGGHSGRKWAWYTISCLAYLTIVYQVGFNGRRAVASKDNRRKTLFGSLSSLATIVLLAYLIVWAASSNARRMSIDGEVIFYAILDLLVQGLFGYWLLISHNSMSTYSLNMDGFWASGIGTEGNIRIGNGEES